jgi:hypothetical protein
MSSDTVIQIALIAIYVVISGFILFFFDHPRRPFATVRKVRPTSPSPATAPPAEELGAFDRKLGRVLEAYDLAAHVEPLVDDAERQFRQQAKVWLEPFLDDIVRSSRAHGATAAYELRIEDGAASYRLQIERADHPRGQPLPYISLSRGSEDEVSALYGGTFPAPADYDFKDAEIGWREAPWRDVEEELLKFTKHVFKTFRGAPTRPKF